MKKVLAITVVVASLMINISQCYAMIDRDSMHIVIAGLEYDKVVSQGELIKGGVR